MNDLNDLAVLINSKNKVDESISSIIQRPANIGNVGEYIAAKIFNIRLHQSGVNKGNDGIFLESPLFEMTVNIKWYTRNTGILDITPNSLPDFYLVLSGPQKSNSLKVGRHLPWVINHVYLFDAKSLIIELRKRSVKVGIATSIISQLWHEAMIFPNSNNKLLALSNEQKERLSLFS